MAARVRQFDATRFTRRAYPAGRCASQSSKERPMKRVIARLFWAFAIAFAGCGISRQATISQDELVRRTQEINDAIAPGNPGPWQKYFAEDGMNFDEKGRAMNKAALLKDVSPLPKGYSGSIKVLNAKSEILRGTAVLSY